MRRAGDGQVFEIVACHQFLHIELHVECHESTEKRVVLEQPEIFASSTLERLSIGLSLSHICDSLKVPIPFARTFCKVCYPCRKIAMTNTVPLPLGYLPWIRVPIRETGKSLWVACNSEQSMTAMQQS